MKPRICLLFAGGTIGMIRNKKTGALEPAKSAFDIIKEIPEIQKHLKLDFKMVVNIDSSNMSPNHWTKLAKTIYKYYDKYDGFVVVQGTDSMTYSASALSFALQNLSKPIVFTGSLIPLEEIGSDGRNNLIYACLTATLDIAEVCLAFSNKILRGNRSKKYHESFVAVFHSPNFPSLGELGRPTSLNEWRKKRRKRVLKVQPNFDPNISLLKLFPGFDPAILDKVIDRKARGIVIEGFGPGNVPFLENSIIPQIKRATAQGVPIVITSQMEKGVTNLSSYEAGYFAAQAGAISAHNMTTEATVTKLMWALAQKNIQKHKNSKKHKIQEIRKIFDKNLSGEFDE